MTEETISPSLLQPPLFQLEESIGNIELFPAVWSAAESLAMPEASTRKKGLEALIALGAIRLSPLVAYLVATRHTDPDIQMRIRVVEALADLLQPDERGLPPPEIVRRVLTSYLLQMRQRSIFALLQVVVERPDLAGHVARLMNACPYAGIHLAEILSDRKTPLEIREQAILAVGKVGFLDALPALDRLASRLEARLEGQRAMPFAPPTSPDELELLPPLKSTQAILRSP